MRPLDRDRHDTPKGVERPQVQRSALGRQHPDGLRAQSKRNQRRLRPVIPNHDMPAIGTLACVVLQRAPQSRECVIQLLTRGINRAFAALMHIPPSGCRQADRDRLELETPGDISGDVGNRTLAVGCQENVTTEIKQPGDLLLTRLCFTGSLSNGRR